MYRLRFSELEQIDLNDFDSQVHAYETEQWSQDLLGETRDYLPDPSKVDTSPKFMNSQDYTLNSPLICDELDAYRDYLTTGKKNNLYYVQAWDARKNWMSKLPVDWTNIQPTALYHATCARLWLTPEVNDHEFKLLIKAVDQDAKGTHIILSTFYSGWAGKEIPFMSRCNNSEDTWKYGAFMWEMLKISWILNATTVYERENLQKEVPFSFLDDQHRTSGVLYRSTVLGDVYIGDGVIYLAKIKMIWDRNMVLMFKDTCTARFHTLFSIQHRYQDPYCDTHLKDMEDLYRKGDQVLAYDTKTAYEAFGMVEPLSSLMLSELAGKSRPLIPQFPHFREHVEAKISELVRVNPPVKDLFAHVSRIGDKRTLLSVYGAFRHWGHPFIDYMEGLKALHKNVTSRDYPVDQEYAETLASDLAFKILKKEFRNKFRWAVDVNLLPPESPLRDHVQNNTWPSIDVLLSHPPTWHKLPLLPCWEVPEVVDPSIIYSDKTHSIQRSELIRHLRSNPNSPIPTRKVLDTLLHTKSTNWPEFLREINDKGLKEDDLIIGLKAKEREIKWKGRFFALMSWRLREYFVFTEYLIKQNVIPLFKSLTMADDQTTLIKKMLHNTVGQGGTDYKNITIANHIDYEKWNNFQRYESTAPVFKVLGQFFGLPNLFLRTHEFFQQSLIYYRDRPDLMRVDGKRVLNRYPDKRVCWEGQAGGLEGLRQKGWSVLNLLVIERESRVCNTLVQTLAQGDNQVICTQYAINPAKKDTTLRENIVSATFNNAEIIRRIREATKRIGLKINEDETLQAADLLIYGKTIIYRGNLTCLEEKRYSRITCTTNDQLPSLGNVLATVSTNCLTVAHYSKSPLNAMVCYNWLGNLVLKILSTHNPALRASPKHVLSDGSAMASNKFRIAALYLDPSLGGIAGMSLTRFNLRMFPDPVTEGLSFWKIIYQNTRHHWLQQLAVSFGNPPLLNYKSAHLEKLIEDPSSLNIPRGLSAQNLIKEEIKKALLDDPGSIKHEVIRDAVKYVEKSEKSFFAFLGTITPCFPRFLSEFRSATYFGLTTSIIGLFQNSKTIRNLFKSKFPGLVDQAILQCELGSIEELIKRIARSDGTTWKCSATHADELRRKSWGRRIIGTTVPHPAELISRVTNEGVACRACKEPTPRSIHLIVLVPQGMAGPEDQRGPYHPYLGSSTGENTSLVKSWEKDTDISFLRKASNLRKSFFWFIMPDNNLGRSVNGNLKSMTSEDPGKLIEGFKRTGSALHRYGCSRVSSGGYIANSPVYGSRMIISTDNFQLLGDQNYDFMYQSLMLYAQQTIGEVHGESPNSGTYHFHISCEECLREIEEPWLDSAYEFKFPDISARLSKWKCSNTPWMREAINLEFPEGDWKKLNHSERSREIGLLQGVIFGNLGKSHSDTTVLSGLFPLGLRSKLTGNAYLMGLRDGLYRAATLDATHRRVFYHAEVPDHVIRACYISLVGDLVKHNDFLLFSQADAIVYTLKLTSHRVPPSYPLNNTDVGLMVKNYLLNFSYNMWQATCYEPMPKLWIFADFMSIQLSGILVIAYELAISLSRDSLKDFRKTARELSDLLTIVRNGKISDKIQTLINIRGTVLACTSEVRHAVKTAPQESLIPKFKVAPAVFTSSLIAPVTVYPVQYGIVSSPTPVVYVPRLQNPLISGLRIPQIATGSFLKVDVLLNYLKITPADALVGGDGSGGIGALVLRKYNSSRLIFNSLLEMDNVDLSGSLPRPPSAIDYMPPQVKERCVNLKDAWEHSMDLSKEDTWRGFMILKKKYHMKINLSIFDMEIRDDVMSHDIEKMMLKYLPKLLEINSTLIVKTYIGRLFSKESLLTKLGGLFHSVIVTQNELSSSQTSEVYVVCSRFRQADIVHLYPVWESILPIIKEAFCMQSYLSEFRRAQRVLKMDLLKGIPSLYIPNPSEELTSIWIGLVHDKIAVSRWAQFIPEGRSSMLSFTEVTMCLISNQIIPTNRWSINLELDIPGDQDLSRLFAYYIGTQLHKALLSNNPKLGEICQRMLDNPFFIYFYRDKHQKKKGNDRQIMYSMSWTIHERKGWVIKKKVFLQHKLGLIGSVIRYLTHISKTAGIPREDYWYSKLQTMQRTLTKSYIQKTTGLFELSA